MSSPRVLEGGRPNRRGLYWLPAAGVAATIFVLSSFPDFGALEHPLLKESDKLLHGAVYALLGAAILWGLEAGFSQPAIVRRAGVAALAASLYGITDEIHQRFVPGRAGVWQDWVADAVGAAVGAGLAWVFTQTRHRLRLTRVRRSATTSAPAGQRDRGTPA